MELADWRARIDSLTSREKRIMLEVAQGKQIAYDLAITESTVKTHRHNVMSKLHLHSVTELRRKQFHA